MISDEQLEEFQYSLCNWLRENPPDAKMVLDRMALSKLVIELKSHRCISGSYFEQLLGVTSPWPEAAWEKLRDLSSDLEKIIIFRRTVG